MAKKRAKDGDKPEATEPADIKGAPQVNDIAKPGETPSPATSRPIITNRSGIIKQDPMVAAKPKEDKDDQLEEKDSEEISKKSETKIEPIAITEDTEKTDQEDKPAKAEDETAAEKTEAPEPEEEKTESEGDNDEKPAEDSGDTSQSAEIDSLATSAEAKKNAAQESEEEQKKSEKVQELVANKQYIVPIVEGGHKASSQRFASWLLLFLLLAAVGIYLAIDAGYLDVGISLPIDLIKN